MESEILDMESELFDMESEILDREIIMLMKYSVEREELVHEYYKLEEAKDWKGAIEVLTKLIALGHNLSRYYYDRAECYYELCQYDNALLDYASAISNYPGYGNAYLMRNYIFRKLGNFDAAFDDLEKVRKLEVVPGWIDYEYLMTKLDMGKHEEVINDCKRLMRKTPGNSQLYHARAEGYLAGGNKKAAIRDFTKSYNLDTRNIKALKRCALVRRSINDRTGALKDYNTLTSAPFSYDRIYPLEMKGELLIVMKRYKEAIDVFTQLNRIHRQPDNYFSRGICKIIIGARESGMRDVRSAIKQDPTNTHYKEALDIINSSFNRYLIYVGTAYYQCKNDMWKEQNDKSGGKLIADSR